MADREKGAGGAVTHELKHSTGKGGDEHAASSGSELIGCLTEPTGVCPAPATREMHAMYVTVQ